MPIAVTSRIVSNVVIVDVSGRMCFLEVALYEHIIELLTEGHREFVLNLAGVPYIDSFGLGQLVSIWTSIRSKDGQLILLRPTDRVRQLLQITRLNTIFSISGEESEAIRSVRRMLAASALNPA